MGSSNIRDILTSFAPFLDSFAITSGDGRIKIWDTAKSQIQVEFTDIISDGFSDFNIGSVNGHLSVDYRCMKWISLSGKRKRKQEGSLLLLGTGTGDVIAMDVQAGQLKWRLNDCHPMGVISISYSSNASCIYAAGVDGMISKIDPKNGDLIEKFKASTKAISHMAVSPDGNLIAVAGSQLKLFSRSNNKVQKFYGHPGVVNNMVFMDDGSHIISSSVTDRHIAIWRIDGSKNRSALCVLPMDHPPVSLECKIHDGDGETELCVMAISDKGVCYFWYGKKVDELQCTKATKVSLSMETSLSKNQSGGMPGMIYSSKILKFVKPSSCLVNLAYGWLVKPSFQRLVVHQGSDIVLTCSLDGALLPNQRHASNEVISSRHDVTVLDRAGAEAALLPFPIIADLPEIDDRNNNLGADSMQVEPPDFVHVSGKNKDGSHKTENGIVTIEDQLRSLGILNEIRDFELTLNHNNRTIFDSICTSVKTTNRKMKAAVASMGSSDAFELLISLILKWRSRSTSGEHVVAWIYRILVIHGEYIAAQSYGKEMLESLYMDIKHKREVFQPLLQQSGRLMVLMAQIDKAGQIRETVDLNDGESGEDDVEDLLYKLDEDDSDTSSDSSDKS